MENDRKFSVSLFITPALPRWLCFPAEAAISLPMTPIPGIFPIEQ
jgi:hypothetical protein